MQTHHRGVTKKIVEERARRRQKENAAVPKSGIVERTLPNGDWERTYYGKDMAAAQGEMKKIGWQSANDQSKVPQTKFRKKNGRMDSLPTKDVERYESRGEIQATHEVRVAGVPWGGKHPGCDVCGETHGGLRHTPHGWLCKKQCLGLVEVA